MGLGNVGTRIYAIHEYFRRLTVGQQSTAFLGCHIGLNQSHLNNTVLLIGKAGYSNSMISSMHTIFLIYI